ncbi:MAG TPA: phosphoribosyltransferase, partial [Ilumatobacteraceae bacterium]|nr:phosphoribosyltransferase [Ilumatobacteraceae bacterium]
RGWSQMMFIDRIDAGRRLAERLQSTRGADVVVLGLPRGGVPVALEVARALGAQLDVIVVRKLGVPSQPELAMGAIGEDGVRVVNDEVARHAAITDADFAAVEANERAELDRRARRFRGDRRRVRLDGRTVIVVDDGIATGSTALAACQVARADGAARVVLAVPVAPPGSAARFAADVDELVCLATPRHFASVGQWYSDFSPTTDQEVVDCLADADRIVPAGGAGGSLEHDEDVQIPAGAVKLAGHLAVPRAVTGIVVFAHGSGSSRHSRRNQFVAEVLNRAGLGTLLFDLLTVEEETDRTNVFDVELLGRRLIDVTRAVRTNPVTDGRPIGYFGASTGAAAALWAAAVLGSDIGAVVSRGGRPDLAGDRLAEVSAPTLLIVGSLDEVVLDMNREARARLRCETQLAVVAGASHLFDEPGTLGEAAELARDWFVDHLG